MDGNGLGRGDVTLLTCMKQPHDKCECWRLKEKKNRLVTLLCFASLVSHIHTNLFLFLLARPHPSSIETQGVSHTGISEIIGPFVTTSPADPNDQGGSRRLFQRKTCELVWSENSVRHRRTWACQTGTPASGIRASFGFFNVFISPMWFFFPLRCKMKNWFSPNTPHFWLTHTNNCRQPARRSVNSLICAVSVSTPLAKQVWMRGREVPLGSTGM